MIACRLSASIKSSVLPVSGFAGVEGRRVNSMIFFRICSNLLLLEGL